MGLRRDLEDLGLLKLVLDTNETKQILSDMRESQLEEERRKRHAASVREKNEIAAEIDAIDAQIAKVKSEVSAIRPCAVELEQAVRRSSEPMLFVLYSGKADWLHRYYQVCDELLSDKELEDLRAQVYIDLKAAAFESVAILKRIFPEDISEIKSELGTWSKQLAGIGDTLVTLAYMEISPVEMVKIFEHIKTVGDLSLKLPAATYPMSKVTPLKARINELLADLKAPKLNFEIASNDGGSFIDYKSMAKTKMVAVPVCAIQVILTYLIFIHRFAYLSPVWGSKLPVEKLAASDGEVKLDSVWGEFQAFARKLSLRIVNVEKLNLVETNLDAYFKT